MQSKKKKIIKLKKKHNFIQNLYTIIFTIIQFYSFKFNTHIKNFNMIMIISSYQHFKQLPNEAHLGFSLDLSWFRFQNLQKNYIKY